MPPRARKTAEPKPDPFGPEPDVDSSNDDSLGDEAQTETPPWEVSNETEVNQGFDRGSKSPTDTNEKAKVVTVGSEGKITSTFKGGSGYDKPWVVVHAEDIKEQLSIINDPEFAELLTRVQKANEYFVGQAPVSVPQSGASAPQNGSQGRTQGQPAAATDGPLGPQYCTHGKKKFWSKFDEVKNELVQAYFCPAQKGDPNKCKNQYVK